MTHHYQIRRWWGMLWPTWIVESLWDHGTDYKGRRYQTWMRVGIFFRRSTAERYKAWCERNSVTVTETRMGHDTRR